MRAATIRLIRFARRMNLYLLLAIALGAISGTTEVPAARTSFAAVAAECLVDLTPPPPPRAEVAATIQRDRGAGRPTKRERRDLEKLRGRGAED